MITTTPRSIRVPALAAVAALCAMTGAAYAAGVPAAASAVLHRLGIEAQAPKAHGGPDSTPNHGSIVSTFAKSTPLTGAAKGAAIAALASDGRSHAGEHGKAGAGGSDAADGRTRGKSASSHGKGATISVLAHSTTATGAAKGATISAAASGGKSHAGQHGGGTTGAGHGKGGDHSTHAGGNGGSGGHGKGGSGEA